MRAVIHFTDTQARALDRVTQQERISRNEAVRRAVERCYAAGASGATREELFRRMVGRWRGRGINADAYVASIRKEWTRDTMPGRRRARS